jgi:integrase
VRALADWRDASESEVAADTHRVRKELVDKVREVAPADATVASLAVVLRVLRGKMAHAPRQFNLIRDYARAFVRDTLGRRHELYADVADITPRKTKKKGRTITDVETRPLTPREVQRLAAAFDIAWRSKKGSRGAEAIAMALTGTNPKEYFDGGLRSLADRVHIAGTKQGGRKRDVPRLFPTPLWPHESLAQPEITQSSFARALRIACAATGIECTPYDFRRTFANWLEAAEIPRARRKLYRGHQSGDIGDLYERHEVTAFLLADGAKVRAWIEAELRNSPDNSPNHPGNSTPAVANGEAGAQRVIE